MTKFVHISFFAVICALTALAGDGKFHRATRDGVAEQYIVLLEPGVRARDTAPGLMREYGGKRLIATYENTIQGFAIEIPEARALEMSRNPLVKRIEQNQRVRLATTQNLLANVPGYPANLNLRHLDRIDRSNTSSPMTDDSFSYCQSGSGVRIYIVDTGVFPDHPEFGQRVDPAPALTNHLASEGIDLGTPCWQIELATSNANHGTSVASIAAGEVFGVAKNATIVDARAIPCNQGYGTAAQVYAVLDWIPTDPQGTGASKVVNMSFEFLIYEDDVSALDDILSTYASQNPPIVPVAAAGNSENGGDSWWTRPAQSPGVISAGGLNWIGDTKWQYSNHRVDLYAPAQFVESATYVWGIPEDRYLVRSELGDTNECPWDTCTSGTSLAAPIVSGVAARVLNAQPGLTAQQVEDYIVSESLRTNGNLAGPPLHRDPVLNFPPSGGNYPCQ